MLKGWVETQVGNEIKLETLCASNKKDLDGVCLASSYSKFQQFLTESDYSPIDGGFNAPSENFASQTKSKKVINYEKKKYPPYYLGNFNNCL